MEKDTPKLWRITQALNDERTKGQKTTLEEDGKTLTGKRAANTFAQNYAKESDIPTSHDIYIKKFGRR